MRDLVLKIIYLTQDIPWYIKGTVMQTEKTLINDRLPVLKVS